MPETYGELLCGHVLLVYEDTDPAGSEFCSLCGLWTSFQTFFTGRAS